MKEANMLTEMNLQGEKEKVGIRRNEKGTQTLYKQATDNNCRHKSRTLMCPVNTVQTPRMTKSNTG